MVCACVRACGAPPVPASVTGTRTHTHNNTRNPCKHLLLGPISLNLCIFDIYPVDASVCLSFSLFSPPFSVSFPVRMQDCHSVSHSPSRRSREATRTIPTPPILVAAAPRASSLAVDRYLTSNSSSGLNTKTVAAIASLPTHTCAQPRPWPLIMCTGRLHAGRRGNTLGSWKDTAATSAGRIAWGHSDSPSCIKFTSRTK